MLFLLLTGPAIGIYDVLVVIVNFIRVAMIPYLTVYGWILMCNYHMQQVYGQGLGFIGFLFFLVSITDTGTIIAYMYGQKRHNKFALAAQSFVDLCTWLIMVSLLTSLKQRIKPKYTWQLQNLCLSTERTNPSLYDPICTKYFNSDRYAGVVTAYRAWYSRYKRGNIKYYVKLTTLGRDYACCGVGRVGTCTENPNKLPFYYPKWYLEDEYKNQRQVCYEEKATATEYWYKAEEDCNFVRDITEYPWVYVGCPYELAIGSCQKDSTPSPKVKGCAAGLEQTFQKYFQLNINLLTFYDVIKLVSIVISLMKFFERKANEIGPKVYITPDPPPYTILTILQPQNEEESKTPDNFDELSEEEKAKILEKIYKSKQKSADEEADLNADDERETTSIQ